jgi:SAM-dependent methyltransferase
MSADSSQSASFIRYALTEVAKGKDVLDVGGGEPFGKWMKEYKPLFAGCEYRSFDYDASTGADVVGDIHAIPLEDNSIGGVVCSSVLEHIKDPWRAVAELHRVMKPGAAAFFYVPSVYPYHARVGHYPDYWRFFRDTVDVLFKDFAALQICKRGGYFLALSFFLPLQHRMRWLLNPLSNVLDTLFKTAHRSTTAGYYLLVVK